MDPFTAMLVSAGITSAAGLLGNLFTAGQQREMEREKAQREAGQNALTMHQNALSTAQGQKENSLKGLIESYRSGLGGLGGF